MEGRLEAAVGSKFEEASSFGVFRYWCGLALDVSSQFCCEYRSLGSTHSDDIDASNECFRGRDGDG